MSYTIRLKRSAEHELERLSARTHDRVIDAFLELKENPIPHGAKKLRGRDGYRIRVGDYRILYTIDESGKSIEVSSVAHRKDVYRFSFL